MAAGAVGKKSVFRHDILNPRSGVATGLFLCFLACLFVAALRAHSWLGITAICAFAVLLYASVAYARFEIWESGFSHRDLSGKHVFEFAQIDDALFETVCFGDGSAPVFSVRLKGEVRRHNIPIGKFGVQADALLFTALERYGIIIGHDGSRLVESSMERIREAQFRPAEHNLVIG